MNSTTQNRDAVELLAEEFLARFRRGERPSVSEYTERRPELAEQISRLFPALVVLEQLGASANPGVERLVPAGLTHMGEYRILREVGRGGMGVVFEAVQESLGRHVALKVLPPALCRDKYLERFQREAKSAARLHHTNIVPVFGVGLDAGMHFYVMQFIEGRGLDSVLNEVRRLRGVAWGDPPATPADDPDLSSLARNLLSGSFAAHAAASANDDIVHMPAPASNAASSSGVGHSYYKAVARLGQQAADALHYAHTQGVLHRDVKPSNLLLAAGGTVWVADFGLAKADDSEDLTDTGDLVGTLRYMAPERLQGRCDARSDIHGLGVTLFELLALRPAFDAPGRLRLLDQVARGAAPRLRQLVPDIPRDLEMIVSKATAREPDDRYPSARDLADDLESFLADRPVRARRLPALERVSRWCRRHPAVAALTMVIVALLISGAVGGWWAAARLNSDVFDLRQAQAAMTERFWEARLAQARAGRASRLPGQRFASLAAIAEAARIRPSAELRNEAVACMALVDIETDREWEADLETNRLAFSSGVAFDPNLDYYASTSGDGTIYVRHTATGQLAAKLNGLTIPADFLLFSPDGRYLAARAIGNPNHPCRVWDWRTGKVVLQRERSPSFVLGIDFAADSKSLVLEDGATLTWVSLPTGQVLGLASVEFVPGWLAVGAGDGNRVAVAGHMAGLLEVLDLRAGGVIAVWNDIPTEVVAVAWHPNGTFLAATGRDGNLYTFDLQAQAPRKIQKMADIFSPPKQMAPAPPAILRGHSLEARELTFSPDGNMLVSRGWDSTTRFWDPMEGRELLRVQGASFLRFDRDGRRMAFRGYNSKRLGIWNLADNSVCRIVHGGRTRTPQAQSGASFSPDSRLLATSAGRSVCLWDVLTGRLVDRLNTGLANDVLFDPAGRFLYTIGESGFRAWGLTRVCEKEDSGLRLTGPTPVIGPITHPNGYQLHTDAKGDRLAIVERFARVLIKPPPGGKGPQLVINKHPQVSSTALSPDGRYLATGTWHGQGVRIWDAATGRLLHRLPTEGSAGVGFAPDGSLLLVLEPDGTYRAYRVDSWELAWQRQDDRASFTRGIRTAFHPGGRMITEVVDRVNLRLVDLQSGDELAILPVPDSENLSGYQFSPDGRYVAAVTVQGGVQLWDLTRLRAELRKIGLDWDTSESGTVVAPNDAKTERIIGTLPPI